VTHHHHVGPEQPGRDASNRGEGAARVTRRKRLGFNLETSASPAGLTARARPEAMPGARAANLCSPRS
jgi:hypothetical protein